MSSEPSTLVDEISSNQTTEYTETLTSDNNTKSWKKRFGINELFNQPKNIYKFDDKQIEKLKKESKLTKNNKSDPDAKIVARKKHIRHILDVQDAKRILKSKVLPDRNLIDLENRILDPFSKNIPLDEIEFQTFHKTSSVSLNSHKQTSFDRDIHDENSITNTSFEWSTDDILPTIPPRLESTSFKKQPVGMPSVENESTVSSDSAHGHKILLKDRVPTETRSSEMCRKKTSKRRTKSDQKLQISSSEESIVLMKKRPQKSKEIMFIQRPISPTKKKLSPRKTIVKTLPDGQNVYYTSAPLPSVPRLNHYDMPPDDRGDFTIGRVGRKVKLSQVKSQRRKTVFKEPSETKVSQSSSFPELPRRAFERKLDSGIDPVTFQNKERHQDLKLGLRSDFMSFDTGRLFQNRREELIKEYQAKPGKHKDDVQKFFGNLN